MQIYLDQARSAFSAGAAARGGGGLFAVHPGRPGILARGGCLCVSWNGSAACIQGAEPAQFFRGLGLLKERLEKESSPFELREQPVFRRLGASFDLSRNAVLRPEALRRLLCWLALMGYNEAYLYTEDTYELPEYPFFRLYARPLHRRRAARAGRLGGRAGHRADPLHSDPGAPGALSALGEQRPLRTRRTFFWPATPALTA